MGCESKTSERNKQASTVGKTRKKNILRSAQGLYTREIGAYISMYVLLGYMGWATGGMDINARIQGCSRKIQAMELDMSQGSKARTPQRNLRSYVIRPGACDITPWSYREKL